jgi:phenylpropionate dioxygenase-like ring-hydroxylating dioxygenase large terminal subunit
MAVWTAIGLSSDLEAGMALGVIVEGREWALWRGVSGRAHLWEDRCPHRGMRMSFGFVRGDRLACLYHGWQYDEGGRCRYIPAHPDLSPPETIRVPEIPVAESGGLIWAAFDGEAGEPPDFPDATPVRSLYLDAPCPKFPQPAEGARDAYLLEEAGARLLVAGHAVDAAHCALHIVCLDPSPDAGARKAQAQWAIRLRRQLEGAR